MRNVCCGMALLVLSAVVGCGVRFETRTYPLGPKPEAAREVIDQITTDETKQHVDDVIRDTPTGEQTFVSRVIQEEGVVVVRTTPQGHRRIAAALDKLQSQ